MSRLTWWAYFITACFLAAMFSFGLAHLWLTFSNYGFIYEVTSVTMGQKITYQHTILQDILGLIFLLWIQFLLFFVTVKYKQGILGKRDNEDEEIR